MNNHILDDYIILNNLDGFRAKLQAMEVYTTDTQRENIQLNEKLAKREKKYQKIKAELNQFRFEKIRLEGEINSLRAQLDIYKGFISNSMLIQNTQWHQHNNLLVNRPTNTTINVPIVEPCGIPTPPIPPSIEPIETQTSRILKPPNEGRLVDKVMDELRSKIKLID